MKGLSKYLLLLSMLIMVSFLKLVVAEAASAGEIEYAETEDGIVITGYVSSATSSDALEIPCSINGREVIGIFDRAFMRSEYKKISLPNTIRFIGVEAFASSPYLKEINLPDSIVEIKDKAFYSCPQLTNVLLPKKLETIGIKSFYGSGVWDVLYIPKETSYIGYNAFTNTDFKSVRVDNENEYFSTDGIALFDKNKTLLKTFPRRRKESYVMPMSVEIIEDKAFFTSDLLSVKITNRSINIGEDNFFKFVNPTIGKVYTTIYCYKNSTADIYAKANNFPTNKIIYLDNSSSGGSSSGGSSGSGGSSNSSSSNSSSITGTWKQDKNGWWLQKPDGSYTKSEWSKINGKWYWFNAEGYMTTGWQKLNNIWYFLNSDGSMVENNWTLQNGKWYFLNADGSMKNGWLMYNNNWYYLNNDGYMAINITTPDGYTIDGNGVWIK